MDIVVSFGMMEMYKFVFVDALHLVSRKNCRGRSPGHRVRESGSYEDERDAVDHTTSSSTTLSRSKSSTCDRRSDINQAQDKKLRNDGARHHLAQNADDASSAIPVAAVEQISSETGTTSCSDRSGLHRERVQPSGRLFQLSVMDVLPVSVRESRSQTEVACSGLDQVENRRNKRCRLSKCGQDATLYVTDHSAHTAPNSGGHRLSNDVVNEEYMKKEEPVQRENAKHSSVRPKMKHSDTDCIKDKRNEVSSSRSAASVTEARTSSERYECGSEKRYNLRYDHSDTSSYNSESLVIARKSVPGASKHQSRKKPAFDDVSHEVVMKQNDSDSKGCKAKPVKSPQKGGKKKNKSRAGKANNEVACGDKTKGRSDDQGRRRNSAECQERRVRGNIAHGDCISSTFVPADSLKSRKKWSAEPNDCHTAYARGGVVRNWYEGALPLNPHWKSQKCSTRSTAVNGDRDIVIQSRTSEVCISEDWESDLFVLPSAEHIVTATTDSIADGEGEVCCVEEELEMSGVVCDGSTACSGGITKTPSTSTASTVNEISGRLLFQAGTCMDHGDNQDSVSSIEEKMGFECAAELTCSQAHDKKFVTVQLPQSGEVNDTSVTLECSQRDDFDSNFATEQVQKIPLALQSDIDYSNTSLLDAEHCDLGKSDEDNEPYEIEASSFSWFESEKCSKPVSTGKRYCCLIFFQIWY